MNAREEILTRVRAALAVSQDEPAPTVQRNYRTQTEDAPGSEPVIAQMVDALEDYKATVIQCEKSAVPKTIAQLLGESKTVVIPDGLPQDWVYAIDSAGRQVSVDTFEKPLTNHELDQIEAVVTASRLGISLTGTIVLDGQSDQGRRAITLVPDIHVVVLNAGDIVPTVPQGVAILNENPTRPMTWIAGPSATSDIELIRVDGVHGPRKLLVIIAH